MSLAKQVKSKNTKKAVDAVYENGAFRVLGSDDLQLPEGQLVHLTVEPIKEAKSSSLELLMHMYDGLTEEQIDEIEKIILDRNNFFAGRPRT